MLALLLVCGAVGATGAVAGAGGPTAETSSTDPQDQPSETATTSATVTIDGTFTRMAGPDGDEYVPIEGAYAQLVAERDGQREQVAVQQLGEDGSFSFEITDREVYYDYYGATFYVTVCAATDAARIVDPSRLASTADGGDVLTDNQPDTPPRSEVDTSSHTASAQRASPVDPETHDDPSDAVCGYEAAGEADGALWAMRTDRVRAYYASDLRALEGEWRPPADEDYNYSGAFSALAQMQEMYTTLSSINETTESWRGQRRIPVRWPTDDTKISYDDYEIYLQDDADHDPYRDTVLHEYAHAVMYDLYSTGRYPESGRPSNGTFVGIDPHNPGLLSSLGFALTEGWAEFLPNVVQEDGTYWSFDRFDVESTNFYDVASEDERRAVYGAESEGAVLNVLHDVADDGSYDDSGPAGVDDDGIDGRFVALWRIMKFDNPDNVTHIRTLWRERGYGQEAELDAIYERHGMPSPDEPWFTVRDPSASPDTNVEPGTTVRFSVDVENRPGSATTGTRDVAFVVDGTTVESRSITLAPGEREEVRFERTFEQAGNYTVELGGRTFDVVVEDLDQPEVYAREVTANASTARVGEDVAFTVTYENVGEVAGTVKLLPVVNGSPTVGVFPDRVEVGSGETRTETFTWSFDEAGVYEVGAVDTVETDTTVVEVTNESSGEPDVAVTDASLDRSTVTVGEAVTVTATVENAGDAPGNATLELTVDGDVVETAEVTLGAGETTTVTFRRSFATPGTYDLGVSGVAVGTLTVEEAASPDVGVTDASLGQSTVATGETVTVSATVENAGDATGNFTARLTVDGTVVATREVTLAAGESTTVAFDRTFDAAGTYDLAVGGVTAGTLTVEAPSEDCSVVQAVAAFDGDPTTVSYSDYDDAYVYYYYGYEVPDTGGETISYSQLQTIRDRYRSGETVEPCQ